MAVALVELPVRCFELAACCFGASWSLRFMAARSLLRGERLTAGTLFWHGNLVKIANSSKIVSQSVAIIERSSFKRFELQWHA